MKTELMERAERMVARFRAARDERMYAFWSRLLEHLRSLTR